MIRLLFAAIAMALSLVCPVAAEVTFISPRDGLLTTDDTLVVIGRAQRGERLEWSVRRDGSTERDTITADWGNLFEIFVLLDPGVNRIRVEDATIEVFYNPDGETPPTGFEPQFLHASDIALCEDCHDPRHVRLLDGGYPWVCFGCHLVVSSNPDNPVEAQDDRHFRTAVADCGRCHEPHLSRDPKLQRATTTELCAECHPEPGYAASTHPALEEGECTACHDPHFSGYPAALHQPLPGLCQRCHNQGLQVGEPHPALAEGDSCGSCHDPHGNDQSLLTGPETGLCVRCHGEITKRGHGEKLSGCGSCHDPHGTRGGGMLRTTAANFCLECHDGVGRGATRHAALEEGCQACHQPHGDDSRRRARESCGRCHDLAGDRELAGLHGSLNVTAASCGVCHPPHSSELPRLLRGNLHQPLVQGNCSSCHGGGEDRSTIVAAPAERCRMCHVFEKTMRTTGHKLHSPLLDGDCTVCHDPHMSNRPAFLRDGESALCRGCHKVAEAGEGKALHAPAENCTECHDPHGGANPGFLPTPRADTLCLDCHDDPGQGMEVLHPAMDDGCTTCHDPHAGTQPGLQRRAGNTLCRECHGDQHGHTLDPARSQGVPGAARFPVDRGEYACIGCHAPHAAQEEYLFQRPAAKLCVECHDPKTRRR